jgi:hypothetical protein
MNKLGLVFAGVIVGLSAMAFVGGFTVTSNATSTQPDVNPNILQIAVVLGLICACMLMGLGLVDPRNKGGKVWTSRPSVS